jgi:hypothetical protein
MAAPDIEARLEELREYYPSDEHVILDEALETIRKLRAQLREIPEIGSLKDFISELNPAALFIDGMDEALMGYAGQWGSPILAVYSAERIVEILARDMSYEEAIEFFEFNIECAYLGPGTPLILHGPRPD